MTVKARPELCLVLQRGRRFKRRGQQASCSASLMHLEDTVFEVMANGKLVKDWGSPLGHCAVRLHWPLRRHLHSGPELALCFFPSLRGSTSSTPSIHGAHSAAVSLVADFYQFSFPVQCLFCIASSVPVAAAAPQSASASRQSHAFIPVPDCKCKASSSRCKDSQTAAKPSTSTNYPDYPA